MADKRRAEQIDALLDDLDSPTVVEISEALAEFDADDVAAVAARRSLSPSGGSSTVQQVTVSLSSAQLLSLFSSPVTLVPAPGAGKAIQVLGVFGIFEAGETPYVDGDGEKIAYATDLFDPVADSPWDMTNPDSNGGPAAGKSEQGFDPSVWLNADVVIGCPTTDPTEGDGTALIVVTFTVIDFT